MTFYLPILGPDYTAKMPGHWLGETAMLSLTREAIVSDIYTGQIEGVERILEIDEAAGTVKDVTKEIAIDVGDMSFADGETPFSKLCRWLDDNGAGYWTEDEIRRIA
jgi:hypothetical protein